MHISYYKGEEVGYYVSGGGGGGRYLKETISRPKLPLSHEASDKYRKQYGDGVVGSLTTKTESK